MLYMYNALGVVQDVDINHLTMSLLVNNGLVTDVAIPQPFYSSGTGIFVIPSPGDIVSVGYTQQGDCIALSYHTVQGAADFEDGLRPFIKDNNTIVIRTRKHAYLQLGKDVRLFTAAGNTIRLSGDEKNPIIGITSPKAVEISVGAPDSRTVININKDDSKPSRVMVTTPEGAVVSINKDGTVLVRAKKFTFEADMDPVKKLVLDTVVTAAGTAVAANSAATKPTLDGPLVPMSWVVAASGGDSTGVGIPTAVAMKAAYESISANSSYPWWLKVKS
jgi:hypothetical protein